MSLNQSETLLHTFLSVARNADTVENLVLECGIEQWTYGDLDTVSSAIALELLAKCGDRPTVASLHENHPIILAILLATWKLGGIFAPLDPHAPPEMMHQMLANLQPTYVVVSADNDALKGLVDRMEMLTFLFSPKNSTVTHLTQRYMHQAPRVAQLSNLAPSSSSLALYLHTSSASSISNLKCVPISHGVLAQGSRSRIAWIRHAWPSIDLIELRVMGWTPWSHIMGISHDLGAATFGTGGCYVFGTLPSAYGADSIPAPKITKRIDELLGGVVRIRPDVLNGVPWLLEGMKEAYTTLSLSNGWESAQEAERMKETLTGLKYLGIGGATTNQDILRWAVNLGMRIVLDLGLTELGRPLFHAKITAENIESEGWTQDDCLIEDAELTLVDDAGRENVSAGELLVTSGLINTNGYFKYDTSAFSFRDDGKVSFRTGDIYSKDASERLVWKGRKEDYIQLTTSETLDPRPIEAILKSYPDISDCCIIGNNFLRKPSDFICAIIRPSTASKNSPSGFAKITRAMAAVNRTLLPPLRIPWSRVLILGENEEIPYTRKGTIFRKKLEDVFGSLITFHLSAKNEHASTNSEKIRTLNGVGSSDLEQVQNSKEWRAAEVERLIMDTLVDILGVSLSVLSINRILSFAELGMDSDMAVRIVNKLNSLFDLQLPSNTCHTFVDVTELVQAILLQLGIQNSTINQLPSRQFRPIQHRDTTVVIVGQAFRLPGNINTPEFLWEALINKRDDIITEVPSDRWDHKSFYRSPSSTAPAQPCDITFEKAGFIDVAHYDNAFFEISAPEALFVGPNIRLTLETAFEALEDACIPVSKVRGTKMGVFVGTGLDVGYHEKMYMEKGFETFNRFYGTGMAPSTACGRLSYLLDIHGPSITVDTACSSGLVAFDHAVKYLESGGGESAIVSAVSTNIWPGAFGFLSAQKMASPNSRCATFTDKADGYVPSEGCVSLILKTRAAALHDGDKILAVVKSSAVMHGGKSQGLVAPNVHTQIELQRELLLQSGLKPTDIDFLEAHGTGTALGDLIEIQGINEVFHKSHPEHPLIIGAAKSSIGHTEFAAGLVGILKTLASFKHSAIPGLKHLTKANMNPALDIDAVPLLIPHDTVYLPHKEGSYHGLILANGFAGTIAGTILENSQSAAATHAILHATETRSESSPMIFVISAKTIEALNDYIRKYVRFCESAPPSMFPDICYTSCVGREHYRYRFSCVVSSLPELVSALKKRLLTGSQKPDNISLHRIAFAFPGQGSQYPGMASSLADRFVLFGDIVRSAALVASEISGYPILSLLLDSNHPEIQGDTGQCAQICIFVYQYSVATWLMQLGISPAGVLGHSLGEISGAVISGAMTYELGIKFVIYRAAILKSEPERLGAMAIIAESKEGIQDLIGQLHLETQLVIAVYNSPQSHVISGDLNAVNAFVVAAKTRGWRAAKLNISQAFHSPLIHAAVPLLQQWIDGHVPQRRLQVPVYSTVLGKEFPSDSSLPLDYWSVHARDPVKFCDAVDALISSQRFDLVLDIGPQPFIWSSLQEHVHNLLSVATSTRPSQDQISAFLRAMSTLFENGVNPNFEDLSIGWGLHKTSIPTYPFQRRRHFPTSVPSRVEDSSARGMTAIISKPIAERSLQFPIDASLLALLTDHTIEGRKVVPGAALVDFFAVRSEFKSLKSIVFHSPMVVETRTEPCAEYDRTHGSFSLSSAVDGTSSNMSKICSGTAHLAPAAIVLKKVHNTAILCESRQDKGEVYSSFKGIVFGPLFRNIQELRIWATHADAIVNVDPTQYPVGDRIRKLDCCLHTFGAVMQGKVPQIHRQEGSFLPASLEGFTLHSINLPDSFICRYHLPLETTRNFHVISASFEVLSHSGELLISCDKYSVVWLARGAVIQNAGMLTEETRETKQRWFQQSWVERSISDHVISTPLIKHNQLLRVGYHRPRNSCLASLCDARTLFLDLPADSEKTLQSSFSSPSLQSRFDALFNKFDTATNLSIIVDLTGIQQIPYSSTSIQCHHHILNLMQLLLSHKISISNFLLISEMSVSVENDIDSGDTRRLEPSLASLVQGMTRVYRRESALDTQVWALDVPPLEAVGEEAISEIILRELDSRQKGLTMDRTIAYRMDAHRRLRRRVPVLLPMDNFPSGMEKLRPGISLIVGLGSIGCVLAPPLVSRGGEVIFIGRRRPQNSDIEGMMARLQSETDGRCFYIQADVNDLDSLRNCLVEIQARHGAIQNIIHTAAVVHDATIQNTNIGAFEEVLAPKVTGAWNLHVVSQDICLSLQSFVLLSSVSVPLGNIGQVAYVAGNHYMEVLASHRRAKGLPGVCIQLGAWKSQLTDDMDDAIQQSEYIMENETGIPLLLQAMAFPRTVQMVANLPIAMLVTNPAFYLDPLFQEVVPKSSRTLESNQTSLNDASDELLVILRTILELGPAEKIELNSSLTASGIDSIAFAQIRGQCLSRLNVEVPMKFLSDSFTIHEMVAYVSKSYNVLHGREQN